MNWDLEDSPCPEDSVPIAPLPPPVELVGPSKGRGLIRSRDERETQRLKHLENELLESALLTMRDVGLWREIDPEGEDPPEAFIERFGIDEAEKIMRVAKTGWSPSKDAPVALMLEAKIALGIIRARATEKTGRGSLNVAVVSVSPNHYPVHELDE